MIRTFPQFNIYSSGNYSQQIQPKYGQKEIPQKVAPQNVNLLTMQKTP